MSTSDWVNHVKRVKDAYEEAGIRLSYNQALVLAKESYREYKKGNPRPEVIIDEDKIPEHQAGRKTNAERVEKVEPKYVEPNRVEPKKVRLPPPKKTTYEDEEPRRRRVVYEDEEDYRPAPRRRPPPRDYYEDEYEEDEYPPPRRGRGRGVRY